MQCIIMENTLIKLPLHDETKKRAHDSQIVRAKENLKFAKKDMHLLYKRIRNLNLPIDLHLQFFNTLLYQLPYMDVLSGRLKMLI